MAAVNRDVTPDEHASITEEQQPLKLSRDELKCQSILLSVTVSGTQKIVEAAGKSFTSYTIQVKVRFEQFQSLPVFPSASSNADPDSSGSASAVDHLFKSGTVRIEAKQFTIEKRFSDFFTFHEYLLRHFRKFFNKNSKQLALPKRILPNSKLNFDQETLKERAQAFENFVSTLLRADEPIRSQLFSDETVSGFVFEPLRSTARCRLQIGQFGESIADLLMLRTIVRCLYRTEAHALALRTLLSLLIAHTYADPRTLPSSTVEQLQAELESAVDSEANSNRSLLYAAAIRYAERAWLVLETCSLQLLDTATYRDALACAIEWLAAQCNDPLLRNRIEARYGIHRPDSFPPRANISMLYEAVIRDGMP